MQPRLTASSLTFLLLFCFLLFTFFFNLSVPPIYIWDEARRANDALQMYYRGDWIINYYDDNPEKWSTKSPILLWLQVASMKLFGPSEWSLRFPSAVASMLIGMTLWYCGKRYFNNAWIGLWAGCVFASTGAWVYNHAGRTADYDALLTLCATLYCICFFVYGITKHQKWLRWFWVFLTLAVLLKGAAGLFFVPGLLLFAATQKLLKNLLYNKWMYIGGLGFVLVISGYYLFREWYAPGFLKAVYDNELGGRYLTPLEGNGQPFLYYIKNFFTWRYTYWIYFVAPAFLIGFFHPSTAVKKVTLFNFILVGVFLLIISVSKTKLNWYDLPMYPFLSMQIAILLDSAWQYLKEKLLNHFNLKAVFTIGIVLFILVFLFPFRAIYQHHLYETAGFPKGIDVEERRQGLFLQQAIRNNENLDHYIFLYDGYDRHLNFYIKLLQNKKVNVQLTNNWQALQPGHRVVVSQPEIKKQLQKVYKLIEERETFGCWVYRVQ